MARIRDVKLEEIKTQLDELKEKTKMPQDENRDNEIIEIISLLVNKFAPVYTDSSLEQKRVIAQLASVEAKVEQLTAGINSLCKVVKDGNGQPSLLQRVTTVETYIKTQDEDIKRLEQYNNAILQAKYMTRKELIVGMFSAVASVVALFASYLAL